MLTPIPWRMMVRGCALGVIAGLLVVAFELDFPGRICEYNQATKHEDCATYSFLPFLLIQVGKTLNNYGVAITAVATVAIGYFTFTLKSSTDRLWEAGEKQRKLYEDTAKRQLRAYLGIKSGNIISRDGGFTFTLEIVIINSGQTPAREVTQRIAAELQIKHGPPLNFEVPSRLPGEWVMVPNMDFILKRDVTIGGLSEAHTIDIGRKIIFTWGIINYIDVFDRPQHFEFRYRSGRALRQGGMGWELEPEDYGNTGT